MPPHASPQHTHTPNRLVVHPAWIAKATLLVIVAALCCGYLTFCALFYWGQWQLVLHPVHSQVQPQTLDGAPFQVVRFGPDQSGQPQRVGWSIPAEAQAPFHHVTLLVLGDGQNDLPRMAPRLSQLRQIGINVFAFDYRGFGQSGPKRPSQQHLEQDADAAWALLTAEQHLDPARIIPYGIGIGGSLALRLVQQHPQIPAFILDGPRYAVTDQVKRDPRVRLLPVTLLFHDRFLLEPALGSTPTPKLVITHSGAEAPQTLAAADPKMTLALSDPSLPEFEHGVARFLAQYAPPTPVAPLPMPSRSAAP